MATVEHDDVIYELCAVDGFVVDAVGMAAAVGGGVSVGWYWWYCAAARPRVRPLKVRHENTHMTIKHYVVGADIMSEATAAAPT